MSFEQGQRVKHRTGKHGEVAGQSYGDPIVLWDGETHPRVEYRSEVSSALSERIYVASSWRNVLQQGVVEVLRAGGLEVYDFKNPPNGTGFAWTQVGLQTGNNDATTSEYLEAMNHPRAIEGFNSDFDAMKWADTFVLVLPCGRSAHLELGWAAGQGKRTAVLLDDPCVPELMYGMVDYLATNVFDLLGWLGVED